MQTASALTTIDHIASTAEAIQMGMNPDDPDSKVPYIDSVTSKFLAYSYSIYHPERPPHPDFKDWPSYEKYLINLEYRSPDWHIEHSKFMSSSGAAAAAGIHPSRTPEKEFCTCRENKPEARSEFEYILFEIGIKMEPFHKMLYKLFNPTRCDIVECGSEIHPKYRWLLTTPDGKVHEFDEKTGTMVYKRRVEFKTPQRRGAFLEVPIEYMTQLQTNMQMDGTEDIDFPVLNLNQKTLETEYIILRAYRSDEYFAQLIERLKMFCRCVLANARPPPRDWDPPPVRTEMLFRITNVIPLIENGVDIVVQAITEAKKEARIKFIKDQERLRFEKQQEEIRRAYAMQDAQKALDSLDLL